MNNLKSKQRGSAIVAVSLIVLIGLGLSILFLSKATNIFTMTMLNLDSTDSQYQVESAVEAAQAKIQRAVAKIRLNGQLRYANPNATLIANGERFDVINNLYATDTNGNGSALDEASGFLQNAVVAQAYSPAGVLNNNDEFKTWSSAFPSTWTAPTNSQYYEIKYTFSPLRVESQVASDPKQILFEYEYLIEARAYGRKSFTQRSAEYSGVISVAVKGAPFSKWSLFADSLINQNGQTLYFAGGNTSAQAQEIYGGPVHINGTPNFIGHPSFLGFFSSSVAEASWNYLSISNYTSCPSQCPLWTGKQGGMPTVTMPSAIFNTQRLAAGDVSSTASTNQVAPTTAEMKSFLRYHADGALDQTVSTIPNGIYVPVNNLSSMSSTGGIYVEGNATVQMNVLQGSTDFNSSAWSQISTAHQTCKFQQLKVVATSASNQTRDIYIGDEPCNVTYIFNGADYTQAPKVVAGRINGNVHVSGAITSLGGASRTRPAVATDFALTISAVKDIYITNDIQYEDAKYRTVDSSGNRGSTIVADPKGQVGGSGILPTAANVAAEIDSSSRTVLGLMSTQRNVLIYNSSPYNAATSAPDNINLHAAIYAGNSAAYNSTTGLGCGANTATTRGCGTGVLNYATAPNKGSLKFFGGIAEYRDQTTAQLSGSGVNGYSSLYFYDSRLQSDLSPPAFPISNFPDAYGTVRKMKSFRVVKR